MALTRQQRINIRAEMEAVEVALRSINASLRYDYTDQIRARAAEIIEAAERIRRLTQQEE
jgi:hypothetical protein